MEEPKQLVTLLPPDPVVSPDTNPASQRFQFIMNNTDWKLLIKLGNERGDPYAALFDAIYEAVTCDEQGQETDWPDAATVEEAPFFRVQIQTAEFQALGIRPSHFNDYLGETQLIPLVYEMVNFPLEER